jgi:hypothetical protein
VRKARFAVRGQEVRGSFGIDPEERDAAQEIFGCGGFPRIDSSNGQLMLLFLRF